MMTHVLAQRRSLAIGALLVAAAAVVIVALALADEESPQSALPAQVAVTPSAIAQSTATSAETPPTSARGTATASGTPTVTPGGNSRVQWQGREWYLHGLNLPWYNWACDFGCKDTGASSPASQAALAPRFQQLAAAGIHNVRWWVFPGDPWQLSRDASGAPASLDPAIFADFDAALAMAETYDLYYTFVLFSAPSHLPAAWLSDPSQREKLVAVLSDLFARYAGHPRILAWDVINEPEFDVWDGKANQADVQALIRDVATRVHEDGGGALVTVGGAMLDGLPMLAGLGLDFYSPHWYDYMESGAWCAPCTTAAEVQARYSIDAPIVLGEVYAGADTDSGARLAGFYDRGYAGAWSWSLFPERTEDRLSIDFAAAAEFAQRISDDGPAK